jgi:RHS repeat-associated protein
MTSSTVCAFSTVRLRQSRFTGKERDTESGNDYFGARYFGSSMGRFLSPDPSGLFYADPTNPQSLNLYSYAYNNPLSNIDPTGLDACAYDNGDGTSAIVNAADGGAVNCSGNGFYITTTQQVTGVGYDSNGDLAVAGTADGNLINSDGSAYNASQSITVSADGSSSYIGPQAISSGTQYISTQPTATFSGQGYSRADICAASALLHNGASTGLDVLGAIPALGSWSKGAQAAVNGAQLAGGVVSAGMAVAWGTPMDAASSGAGLGLAGAGSTLPDYSMKLLGNSVKVVPFIGNGLSALSAVNDVWGKDGMVNYYNDCMAGKN